MRVHVRPVEERDRARASRRSAKLAAEAGRDPKAILMFAMMTVIVAPTDEEAQAKLADYRRYADPEGALTLMSGWTGVDFSRSRSRPGR